MADDGSQRYDNARRIGAVDRAINLPASPRETDRLAALAEVVFASRYGLEGQIQHGYKPCDIVVGKAHLNIKWTPHEDGHLIIPDLKPEKRHICTAYVLVVGPEGHMHVVGWQWGYIIVAKPYSTWIKNAAWSERQEDLHTNTDILMAATFGAAVVR